MYNLICMVTSISQFPGIGLLEDVFFFCEKKSTFDFAKESIFFAEITDCGLTKHNWQEKVCSFKSLSIFFGKKQEDSSK